MNDGKELTIKDFLKKLMGFSMASWLSAGISFVATPIFTRLYMPEQAGRINLFLTFMTFFQTVCVFALDQAFMRFYNEEVEGLNKETLLKFCLRINFLLSLFSAIVILIGHSFFSDQIVGEKTWQVPICLSVVVVCGTFLRMSSVSSRMEGKVILYSLQVVLVSFVEKVICTLSAFYKPTYQTAIWAITLGFIGISILFLIIHRKKIFSSLSYVPRKTTKSILKFSVPYLPVLLLSWLNGSIPLFALRSYVDYSSIGIYTNAVTIANILSLIQAGFSTYWNPFIYENYKIKENEKKIQRIVAIIIFMLFFLALLVILFQDIIYLLVGEKYRASKLFFPFLMFTPICNCLGDITGIGIMLSKKSYLNIITFSGCAITNILLSFLLVPQIGVMGAGLATAGSALVMLALRSKLAVRYYRAFNNEWKIICPVILMTGASIINGWFDNSLKYIFIILIILMLCAVFREELSYVLKSARKGIKHFFR